MEPVLDEKKRRLLALLMKEKGIDPAKAPIVPLPRRPEQAFPLSFAQERLWVIDQLEPGNLAYNLPTALRLSGRLRPEVLARVFAEVVRRHEALRTTFGVGGHGRPVQVISPPAPVSVPLVDLSGLVPEVREPELRRLAIEEGSHPFDLARGPVLRVRLVRLGDDEHALLLTLHHIASDGWSNGVLVGEVVALYDAFSHGRPSPLPELPIQYADYAAWQRQALDGEGFERALAWWRERLVAAPVLELPTDHPRPAVQGLRGSTVVRKMPPALAEGLKALARAEGATLFMAVTAAFQALLARLSGQCDLTVGTPVANRHKTEVEGLIGFFVNTLVLRTGLSGDPPFRELLARVRGGAIGAFQHGEVPFSRVVEEVKPERSLSHTPLFQVMCALGNAPSSILEIPGLRFAPLDAPVDSAMFDLNLTVTESPAGFGAMLEFRADLFEKPTALRLLGAYETVLEAVVESPDRRLSDLPLLTPPERQALLVEWNDTAAEDAGGSLEEALAVSAERHAEKVALVFAGQALTFREVGTRAARLASQLRSLGVGPGSRVGLSAERSPEAVIGLLAVLKAGAACVPLDPAYPAERRAFMLEDSGATVLLTRESEEILCSSESPSVPPSVSPSPDDLAYLIYTSGSTGRPKGVAMTRRALANLLAWQEREALSGPAKTLQFASLSFDVSFQEIASTWLSGGTLVLVSEEVRRDPFALLALLDRERVERLFLPFVALRQLAEAAESAGGGESLRDVVTAGEQLQVTRAVASWLARTGARLHNHYGPSESHVVTALPLEGDPFSWPALPAIGRPIANTWIRLLDEGLQPVPIGAPGELCIGGVALARGYLDRPELTAERFVPDPFGAAGERLYRTGDLARWRTDGAIEYLGRRDGQVKIRGVRVEPGEVETALGKHPGVRGAVVVPGPEPASPGALRLVAFYVPAPGAEPSPAELRDFLASRLPAAVVPSVFVPLPAFPTTPSGKVDRRALVFEGGSEGASEGYVPPRGQTEELLAGLWSSLLGAGRVGARDNFFELGGHSLLATQLVSRVREVFEVEIPQRALFEAPTVGELARVIEASSTGPSAALLSPVERVAGDGPFPLSFSQERLWLLDQIEPGNAAYNMAAALRFAGDLRPELLAAVLAGIVRRHATLRTTYGADGGAPVQIVHPAGPFHLPVIDLAALPSREAEARRLAGEEVLRPFDLARGPVLRAALLRMGEDDHVLLFNMHHIASDGWSTGILVREVMALYGGTPLPELPVRYVDYAAWQRRVLRGEVLEGVLAYWRERLRDVPVLELPTDRPRAAGQSFEGAAEPLAVSPEVSEALKALGRRHGATLFMALAAAFEALLSRLTNQTDFALGTPVAGRNRVELEDLIGFFVNTLVIRAGLGGDPSFAGILSRVREVSLGAFAHQEMPFERLVEELNPERSLSHSPLFQVMFVLQNAPGSILEIPGLTAVPFETEGGAAKFDLSLAVADSEEGFAGGMEYRTSLFDAATVRRLLAGFNTLLAGIVADPDRHLSELPLLSEAERHQVLVAWNPAGEPDAPEGLLHDAFFAQAAEAPDAPAVEGGGTVVTYGELSLRARALAHLLRSLGAGPEDPVAVCVERSAGLVAAILGVLEAGAAYVPFDPVHPRERLAYMAEDAGVRVIVASEKTAEKVAGLGDVVVLENGVGAGLAPARVGTSPTPAPDHIAYLIYTSGSTGRPKGVLTPHRAAAHLVREAVRLFGLGPGDRVLQAGSSGFDVSVLEIFGALSSGACLCPAEAEIPSGPDLAAEMRERGVTAAMMPPSVLASFGEAGLPALRALVVGAEKCPASLARRWSAGRRFWNAYGPTETTVFVTLHEGAAGAQSPPIGRPIPGVRARVLDRHGHLAPVGVPGELCIGGLSLARGYRGLPDRTAASFVPDPWGCPGERLYRTGDLVRRLPGGELDILGRIDRQVKVRGVRVELEEIEAVLGTHPEVRECGVAVREGRLAAFVVPRDAEGFSPEPLRAFLRERLPEAMVPSFFVPLPALPLSTSGKLDRRALERISPAVRESSEAPRTEAEALLAGIWESVLGVPRVGIADNFFDLGGHSLLATQLVSRVREAFGVEIPLRSLFEAPTVSALAARIAAGGEGRVLPPVVPVPRDGLLRLSFAQERLWVLDQLEPGTIAYNLPAGLRLSGCLRPDILARAFSAISHRHEALRTTFAVPEAGGGPVQVIAPPAPVLLPGADLSGLPEVARDGEVRRLAFEEGGRPFDLVRGPVWRALLVRLGEDDHALLVTMHHIASDGWSMGVLVQEIIEIYGALSQRLPVPLPELPVQYADYAVWQRRVFGGGALEASLDFWRRELAGAPVLDLPTDRPRSGLSGAAAGNELLELSREETDALEALGRRHGATLFMVVMAAFQALLSRYSGQSDLTVGTPVAGRLRTELEPLIGFFVNTLVLRADLAGDPRFGDLLGKTRARSLAAFAHQQVPFEQLVLELNPERSLAHTPLFQVMLALQNTPHGELDVPGLAFRPLDTGGSGAKFDLTLTLGDGAPGLAGTLEYRSALFDAATIRRMLDHLKTLLASAVADPGARVSELPLLPAAELRQVTVEWSGPWKAFPVTACLHELFDRQAERTPGAVAVAFEGESLTYGELRARANGVARRLRGLGVGPESRVGLAAERSLDLIVGLLGILKAGGAYVPIDPSYPEERLALQLEDSGVSVLLTQSGVVEKLPPYSGHVLLLDENETVGESPEIATDPDNAAYVIYTSGSTGKPKGTVVTHRNVSRLLAATEAGFGFGPRDVWTLFHSYAFDFSVWEIWGALAYGGRLVIVPYWVSRSPEAFLALLEKERVTVLNQTPSAFRQLVAADGGDLDALRLVIFGGEALEVAALAPWFDRHGDETPRLVNMYGITETTVHVTWRPVTPRDLAEPHRSPIGPALPDLSVHLLDAWGNPAPVGVPGELCVGGPGLARGYLSRPDLTAERYVAHPFTPGERLYRSGDLARFRPGGEIDYLGRIDHQVKIRGFRIELGEIEAALARHPRVDEAVVLARDEAGDRRLVAYLGVEGEAPSAEELRALLAGTLPDYMVPSAFVVLPALPLTSHGKVDRRALLEIRPEASTGREYQPPRTATEEVLAGLWASVLGAERVGIRDNFFELGGHSLVATRLVARVRQVFGVDVPLRALFEGPTVEELARRVEAGEKGSVPPIVPVPRDGALPLSFAQERLWFLDQFDPGTPALNIPLAMRLPASVEPGLLAQALASVVRRHEALRTTFGSEEGRPFQVIGPPFAPPLPVTDLSGLAPEVRDREAARLEAEEGLLSFDLARGPLLRARLLLLGEQTALLLTVHHIAADGWSMGLLTRELGAVYRGLSLPELPVQYADYAVWQRSWLSGTTLDAQIGYWREKLADPPVLDLPTDRPRPMVQTWRGAGLPYTLAPELTGRLAALARREGATLFMVLLAGFQALLARFSGQDDVIVGAPVAGRVREETEPLLGCFLNNVALRTDLSGTPSFRELLARARATALEAYAHQDVPFEKLLEELRPDRDLFRTPIFQVFLNMLNFPAEEGAPGGFGDAFTPEVPAKFDLTIYAAEGGGSLHLDLVYNAGLFDRERVEEMARQLEILLARAAEEPEARTVEVSLVTEAALLPDPAKPLDAGFRGGIHDALARQDPERVAVVEDGKTLTYGELQAAASGLAGLLASRGIGRGEVVAVWAHRSAVLPGAVLGALRAGAAFMVLDPAYPASRLVDYLRIGRPAAFVAIAGAAPPPPEVEAELDGVCRVELPADLPAGGPSAEVGPEDLAVVTFTSGSTGRPKGVAGRHGPLTHFYPWMAERFGLSGEDRFGMLSALSHDPLQRDLFTPVWLGAALCVPDPERIGSPGYLADWVRREGVTVLHLTPAMLELLVQAAEETGAEMPSLRRAFVVGDLLKRSDVERLYTVAPGITCINLYGSTETQRSVSYFVVPREARPGREVLPLGRGMEDAQLLVLNPAGALAGVGELGEIHMRSAHLALGYLGDPALTAERFLPDGGETRRYRTGDLGRYLPNGDVEFAGRADAQVKIRGFRIEPGEIEAALARFPGVREGVVIAREGRLVAYAVPRPGAEIDAAGVRAFLAARLPGYMVPADVMVLPALPLTRTGKIDRRALPAPERMAGEGAVAPRTLAEETLAGLWRELLGVDEVGVEDDFFDRGGHSLLATQLLSRIRTAFGVELPLRALFERPTIAGMAALLADSGTASPVPPLTRYSGKDEAPLSFAQQRLWFLDQLDPGSSAYNMFQALRLEGDLDEAAFEAALSELVRRQESLRTRFVPKGGQAVQVIDPAPALVAPVADLSALPVEIREREGERIVREEALRPFDLETGPVLRARLLRLGRDERWLVVSMHHIVSDGLSIGIFVHEVTTLYAGIPLPPLAVQCTDFARWQRSWLAGEVLEGEVAWWRERLAGAPPVLALPLDRPRPAIPTVSGGKRSRLLPDHAAAGLLRLARSREATPFMAGLALVDALLSRHTGEDDLVVGTPVANRGRRELEDLIGFFANTLALRIEVRRDLGFGDLLDRVREAALGAYSHQDVPFEKLVEDLAPDRSLRHSPLFQVMFVMVAEPLDGSAEGPIRMSTLPLEADSVRFDLTFLLAEGPRGLALSAQYNAGLFFATTIERLLDHAAVLLTGLVADPHQPVGDLPLLTSAERSQLVTEWNDTAASVPSLLLHELFARHARERPEAVAAVDEHETVSFRELDARAGRLARHLRARGAGPEVRVGLAAERSVGLAVGILGILKSGAAWVPLDLAWPRERLDLILEDSGVTLIVTEETLAESAAADGPLEALPADPDRLAYVIYTSGSSGRPKGVLVSHRGIASLAVTQAAAFGLGPEDRVLQLASPSFDASVWEMTLAWWAGAELHLAGREALRPGEPLARLLGERRITGLAVTPTALAALPFVPLPDLAAVSSGGEPCPPDLADRWAAGRIFYNVYGPTEATAITSLERHREGDPITLGRPIANSRLHLVDDRFGLVPLGVPGEITVAGPGLARGYLGRPDLTADRFVPDPWGRPGDRLYRTGDLGRRLPDGEIEFLGRADQQVKVRGVRIEPGEVEAALLKHPAVREAAAGVRSGELVAWIAASPRPAVAELRRFLGESLPEALIPTAFVFLDELPKTPAGKTDRRSLPDPGRERAGRAEEHVPPGTPEERLLADLWTEVLGAERPGVTDNFFDLGGHSLLATQLLSRMRDAFRVEVPLRALFEQPTIRGMAGLLAAGEASSAPPLVALPHTDDPPLSFAQQRLWFIHQLDPGSGAYNMHQVLRLGGELDEAALGAALRELVRRQAALRTRFATRGHQAVQVIGPVPEVLMPVADLSALPESLRNGEAERIAREESLRPFDLQRGPVLRVRLLRLAPGERLLAVAMHHIVSDGWSLGVFVHEVTALYAALSLPPLPVQYADYARWQREWLDGETLEREIDWWRRHLGGAPPVLDLPLDRPRPALQSYQGDRRSRRLPEAASASLLTLAHAREATPFMAGFALVAALLARHTGADDLVIGTPIANRNRREIEGVIGFFANTLALRARVRPDRGFAALLDDVRETALGAYTHQDVPFERIVEELAPERNLATTPLFQVVYVMNPAPPPPATETGPLSISVVQVDSEEVKFDLVVSIEEGPRGLDVTVRYNSGLFLGATIERLLEHAEILLEGIAADPDRPVAELPVLSEAERIQVTRGPEADFPVSASLAKRFVEQARRNPSAVAAGFEGTALTYEELDLRANRLARHLRRLGVGPEVRVGLAAERSLDLIVGLLAILKAGGAYVPIDPSYPEERLSFLLEDAFQGIAAPVLLTESSMPFRGTVVHLNGGAWEEESGEPLPSLAGPENAAYVIYTSGSTGKPKGTVVTHGNVLRLFAATGAGFGFGPGDVWTLFHSYAFDFSVWEIWGALLYGGRLVVVPFWVSRSPGEFLDLLARERVTVLSQTPSAFRQLVAAEEVRGVPDLALRFVVFGGEALDLRSLAPWLDRHGEERPRLVNMYGITETTVHVTWRTITRADLSEPFRSPVGVPIPDLSIHLLDAAGQPVPVGVPGEIHVGGAGLARGYLGRPDLTAERYVPNPFGTGERLYRSGDLARWRPDGELDFLGRIDHQVKVRGFRIELGEIEAALGQHPAVKENVVLLRDVAGDPQLVAWLGVGDAEPPSASDLRAFLSGKLPEPMIPAAFAVLPALPLTAHGKVDRRALPDPGAPKPGREAVPPTNAVERFLVDLWESVLGISGIGIHDDFFELGGNSIKAAILTNALEERLGEYVFVVALFDAPTVARLALYLETHYPAAVARITGEEAAAAPAVAARIDEAALVRFRSFIHPLPPPGPERAGRPKNPPAVFLLSPPRSGSTLLRVMLGGHPALFAPPELELLSFETLRERKAAFSGRYSFWTEGTLRAILEIEGSGPDRAREIMELYEERDWTVRDFYRELQARLGHRLLVDKTPSYALDPNVLARAEADFDEPVYIHLVRHPYGMIRSFEEARLDQIFFRTEHPFSRRELAELIWTESEKNVLEFLAGVPAHRQILVRFEDLVRDPRREMEKICAILGIDLHPAMLDPYEDSGRRMTDGLHAVSRMLGDVKFHEHQGVDAEAADRWKEEITEDFLGDVTWDLAGFLGYEVPRRRVRALVPLRTGGPGAPFFCVHPAGGNVLCYAGLAREVGPDRPFYGLQSLGLGGHEPQETVEEMAATYLAEIRAVEPHGPYLLGGWSLGGVVAYEMAQRLRESGEEVALLALIDAAVPGRLPEEERPPREEDADFVLQRIVAELEPAAGEALAAEAAKLADLPPDERLEGVLAVAKEAGYLPPGLGAGQVRRLIRVYRVNGAAWWRYRPAPYPGRALLLRATEGPLVANPSLDWHGLLTGDWETMDVPGTHQALMAEPAVHDVAGLLRDRLSRSDE